MPPGGETDPVAKSVPPPEKRYGRELKRGSITNALGTVGRLLYLAYIIVATRLFGEEAAGLYSTAFIATELAASLVVSGLADGTVLFGSRETELANTGDGEPNRIYEVFANAFVVSLAISVVWIVVVWLFGHLAGEAFWSDRIEVVRGAQILAAVLPARAIMEISVAATKSNLRMDVDAWVRGGLRPLALLLGAVIAKLIGGDWITLCISNVVAEFAVAAAAFVPFSRMFRVDDLARAIARFRPRSDLLRFAAPQGASTTLYQYITQIDVLMLAALGVSAPLVAFYWIASVIAQNLRQIRVVFSNALMPVLARHHAVGEVEAMEILLGRLSRWALTLVALVVLLAIGIRDDILALASETYRGGDAFVLVLFAIPIVNCGLGLAANAVIATGHSQWGLLNAIIVATTNTVLNLLWIPEYGVMGAAVASLLSTLLILLLNIAELRWLERVRWRWSASWTTLLALTAALGFYAAIWDPVSLSSVWARAGVSIMAVLVFVVAAALFGHPEIRALVRSARAK